MRRTLVSPWRSLRCRALAPCPPVCACETPPVSGHRQRRAAAVPSWSDAGSRAARDDVAASRCPRRSAAEQAHKPCVVVRLLHTPALFRRLPRRHVLSSSPYSLASRARSQLAAVVHLTPRAVLQLPCSRLPFAALFYRWRGLCARERLREAAATRAIACQARPNCCAILFATPLGQSVCVHGTGA